MAIHLVAAQAENHVIGRGIEIPWRVKGEQKLFKQITMGGTLYCWNNSKIDIERIKAFFLRGL